MLNLSYHILAVQRGLTDYCSNQDKLIWLNPFEATFWLVGKYNIIKKQIMKKHLKYHSSELTT